MARIHSDAPLRARVPEAVETLHKGESPSRRRRLENLIESLDADTLTHVVRAFSIYFSLVNLAEESFQHQTRCAQVRHDGPLWNGSFYATLREFCADCGGAQLAGRQAMIAGGQGLGLKRLFMTHPPLGERIEACATVPGHNGAAA